MRDPRLRDTDLDGLSDYEEITGLRVDGNVVSQMVSIDIDDSSVPSMSITPYLGGAPDPIPADRSNVTEWAVHSVSEDCEQFLQAQFAGGYATDPLNADTDEDGLPDLLEYYLKTDPRSADSDLDRINDADEYRTVVMSVWCGAIRALPSIRFRPMITLPLCVPAIWHLHVMSTRLRHDLRSRVSTVLTR